mmetsp:Transcript_117044/g.372641  ORF Transcript_117044/g.372641 Transcript_117044/m.372641 type:complete len:303 (+) Transcript_117044:550-1458(+)
MPLQLDAPALQLVHEALEGRGRGGNLNVDACVNIKPRGFVCCCCFGQRLQACVLHHARTSNNPRHEHLPGPLLGLRGAAEFVHPVVGERVHQGLHEAVKAPSKRVQLLVTGGRLELAIEVVWYQPPHQLDVLVWVRQEPQPDHSWEHQEELNIALLEHSGERGDESPGGVDGADDLADRLQQGRRLHEATGQLPAVGPGAHLRDQPVVVAEMRVHRVDRARHLMDVAPNFFECLNDTVGQDVHDHTLNLGIMRGRRILRAIALLQGLQGHLQNLRPAVMMAFPTQVGRGVQARQAGQELAPL